VNGANSFSLFESSPSVVLAIYAHPDDADVACGGSLARWVDEGARVHVLLLTDGAKGTTDASVTPSALATTRKQEVAKAAKELGGVKVESLGFSDGDIGEQGEILGTLVRRIRELKPDVVLGHDPTAVFFGSVYVNHQDHRAAGWAVLDAVGPASSMPHYFPECGLAHRVHDVLLSGTLEPDTYVDITSSIDQKVKAVTAHHSQLPDDPHWAGETIRQQASDDGSRVGVAFAEGFRHLRLNG
jgi:LmbE family N-acetylglucosaminyl deacetylase